MTTIKQALVAVIGQYEPQTAGGIASIDWSFLGAVALLCISVFCIYKIIGLLISRV